MRNTKTPVLLTAIAVITAVGAIVAITAAGSAHTAAGNAHRHGPDRSASNAYLQARLALVHALVAELPAGDAPMNAFVANVRAECPGALGDAPVNARPDGAKEGMTDEELLVLEGDRSLEIAERSVNATAVETFAAAVRRLRWHDQRLTALVRTFAQIETERVQMHTPDLCGQIEAWAASGYRTLPHETEEPSEPGGPTLARELAALGCGMEAPQEAIVALLRHYQRTGERPTTMQVELAEFRWRIAEIKASLPAEVALERALDVHVPAKTAEKRRRHKSKDALPSPYTACTERQEPISEPVSG